jgi:hypothetical protein
VWAASSRLCSISRSDMALDGSVPVCLKSFMTFARQLESTQYTDQIAKSDALHPQCPTCATTQYIHCWNHEMAKRAPNMAKHHLDIRVCAILPLSEYLPMGRHTRCLVSWLF